MNSWDTPINTILSQIDQNLGAVSTVSLSNTNVTLDSTQSVCGTIRLTGALSGNVLITFPSVSGWWVMDNRTTGAFTVTATCGGGEIVGLPPSEAIDILTDGSNVRFRNLGPQVGGYVDFAGAALPAWAAACTVPPYLLCDGSSFSSGTYPTLAAILGGTTLPDARARVRIPLDGGTGRVTTAGSGIDGLTRLAAGGAQNITLDTTMIPAHTHNITQTPHAHLVSGGTIGGTTTYSNPGGGGVGTGISATASITIVATNANVSNDNTGGGLAHNNMPPTFIGGITMIRAG